VSHNSIIFLFFSKIKTCKYYKMIYHEVYPAKESPRQWCAYCGSERGFQIRPSIGGYVYGVIVCNSGHCPAIGTGHEYFGIKMRGNSWT
jgi:hypothetical protein